MVRRGHGTPVDGGADGCLECGITPIHAGHQLVEQWQELVWRHVADVQIDSTCDLGKQVALECQPGVTMMPRTAGETRASRSLWLSNHKATRRNMTAQGWPSLLVSTRR